MSMSYPGWGCPGALGDPGGGGARWVGGPGWGGRYPGRGGGGMNKGLGGRGKLCLEKCGRSTCLRLNT